MATCEVVWCPKVEADVNKVWAEDFGPMLMQYLEMEMERTGEDHAVDVRSFMMVWEQGGITVILARDNGEPCGFMLLNSYMPLFHRFPVMLVDKWMADTEETERSLFEYLSTVTRLKGIDHVHAVTHDGQRLPEWVNTKAEDSYHFKRLVV